MSISEYSEFYPISFGYLHPEIQSFKKEGEKTKWICSILSHSILECSSAFIHVQGGQQQKRKPTFGGHFEILPEGN